MLGRGVTRALAEVSFRLEAGSVCGLVGPNRAGKTTLVKLLLGLCRPTEGQVTRFGVPASQRRTLRQVGYVHETQAFPRYLSATALLEFHGALALLPETQVKQRVPELLAAVGLADRATEPIGRFSKGMVQRLALALALLGDPDLLVLDEPVEGLDQGGRLLLRDIIETHRTRGRTVLLVSHLLPEVERLCDQVLVLAEGRLLYSGAVAPVAGATGTPLPLEVALEGLYKEPVQWTPPHSSTPLAG